jgi:hypothetical protein
MPRDMVPVRFVPFERHIHIVYTTAAQRKVFLLQTFHPMPVDMRPHVV